MERYEDVFLKLTYETAIVIFIKKNGDIRVMLATRNLKTAKLKTGEFLGRELDGYDRRNNRNNGNIAVIDLEKGQCRAFNINRLVAIKCYGTIETSEDLDRVIKEFNEFKTQYEEKMPKRIDMEHLD